METGRTLTTLLWAIAGLVAVGLFGFVVLLRSRQIHLWFGSYIRRSLGPRSTPEPGPVHVFVCVTDHFEPVGGGVPEVQQRERMHQWISRYPDLALKHRDFNGRPHQHTFFYPAEEYRAAYLDQLAELCAKGVGDVEVHLHHDNDTADNLRQTLSEYAKTLHERHGFLRIDADSGQPAYGFIHGNWALNNSRPDGRWCGVDDETSVLLETGCYADFTLPSAPDATQTSRINSVYYASPAKGRKGHNSGSDARVGAMPPANSLMMIQGPLTLNWRSRKWGIIPRIENGELSGDAPPSRHRVDLWVKQRIHVQGRPNWVFVKLHTHGAHENNIEAVLGAAREEMLTHLETFYNDGERFRLHYVTAYELYQVVRAAERGDAEPPVFGDGVGAAHLG